MVFVVRIISFISSGAIPSSIQNILYSVVGNLSLSATSALSFSRDVSVLCGLCSIDAVPTLFLPTLFGYVRRVIGLATVATSTIGFSSIDLSGLALYLSGCSFILSRSLLISFELSSSWPAPPEVYFGEFIGGFKFF